MALIRSLWERLLRLLGLRRTPPEPRDPYAGVRVPLRSGPRDRSGAVALEEPDDPHAD